MKVSELGLAFNLCQAGDWSGGNDIYDALRKNLRGSMAREDIYKMARALLCDTSPSLKRLPKYLPTNNLLTRGTSGLYFRVLDFKLCQASF